METCAPQTIWTRRRVRCRCGVNASIARIRTRLKSLLPFAALVLVAQITSKADAMTAFWAALFFWARLAHAIVFALGWPFVRTVIFTIGFVAVVGIFWEIVR
jgi:uncharacterized MAPEG superfamily protein